MAEYIVRVEEGSEADLFRKQMSSERTTMYGCAIVGEVVRCEGCKHRKELMGGVCEMWGFLVGSQGFCSWGEKVVE